MSDLVIIGAGGFGRQTIDVVRALPDGSGWRLLGVVDDAPSEVNLQRLAQLGVNWLGGLEDLPPDVSVAVAVGRPQTRRAIVDRLGGRHPFASLVHPTAVIGSAFAHGDGLIVLGGVSIGTNVTLGDHVHLNAHAVLGHDSRVGHTVSINPSATISGDVLVGEGTLVGAGAVVLQGLTVGPGAIVGAAACVVHDAPEGSVVKGVPAR